MTAPAFLYKDGTRETATASLAFTGFQCQASRLPQQRLAAYAAPAITLPLPIVGEGRGEGGVMGSPFSFSEHAMTEQAQQTAKALVQLIPPSVTPDFLEEYGLTLTTQQAQAITKELLALTLYWMTGAVRVSIPEPVCSQMHQAIHEHVREKWGSRFGLVHVPIEQFYAVMERKHQTWEHITQQGGEPIAVLSDAAQGLEGDNVIASHDRQKILAVLLDLVPFEEMGELIAELEQTLR